MRVYESNRIDSGKLSVTDNSTFIKLAPNMFKFFESAYSKIGGFKSFDDEVDLANSSIVWRITTLGPAPTNPADLDFNKVLCCIAFKPPKVKGYNMKQVALGTNRFRDIEDSEERKRLLEYARNAVRKQIRLTIKTSWVEASGGAAKIYEEVGAPVVDPEILEETGLVGNIEYFPGSSSYQRTISTGETFTKTCYGNLK